MSFEAKDYPISTILNKAVFNIPRNQRRYVWKKDNWNDLFEDIIFSIEQNKDHFIGSIVLEDDKKENGLDFYIIIDGQQRLITITLCLSAIMIHFLEKEMLDDFRGTVSYLCSKNNRNQDITIIESEYHVSLGSITNAILALDNSETPEKISINNFVESHILQNPRDKMIGEAIIFFYNAIKDDISKADNASDRLVAIRDAVLDMTAVKIEATSEEDSYTIFEILNARGQELAPSELLKNYIMRYIQPKDRRDEAKSKWEAMEQTLGKAVDKFVKHYATHRFGENKDKYRSPYQTIIKATRGHDNGVLLDDIMLKSRYYERIINPKMGEDGNCNAIEGKIFKFFKEKRFEQFRPIFLSLIHQKEMGKISEERL